MTDEQRYEGIVIIAKRIAQGGWTSIYDFVSNHADDYDISEALNLDEEEEEDE